MKRLLSDLNLSEIQALVESYGAQGYRAAQIHSGVLNNKEISQMNIDAPLKEKLLNDFEQIALKIVKGITSKDGTVKFLFELCDKNIIEGVLMRYKYGNTVCISTQVGCRMGCVFCASGKNGLIRNLSSGEMLSQVLAVNNFDGCDIKSRKVTNVVLMGSGEPLDNYDSTVKFLRDITSASGFNISARNISLSTCGLADKIKRLADEKLAVNLTVSLHSPFDDERKKIMPAGRAFNISQILSACDYYFAKTKRRYIFEYSLISGVNDRQKDLDELIKILKGRPCHINLIRLNTVRESQLLGTATKDAYRFLGGLEKAGISATLRRSMGSDIDGACGQLRNTFVQNGVTRA